MSDTNDPEAASEPTRPLIIITTPAQAPKPRGGAVKATLVAPPEPGGMAQVEIRTMHWWQQILIRAARTAGQAFLTAMGVTSVGAVPGIPALPMADIGHQLAFAFIIAGVAFLIALIQNFVEYSAGWADSKPEMRA